MPVYWTWDKGAPANTGRQCNAKGSQMLTIAKVLGGIPWQGPTGIMVDVDTRAAVRTFLNRCGWPTESYINLSLADLSAVYCDRTAYAARMPEGAKWTSDECIAQATSEYAPRNARLVESLQRRGLLPAAGATAATPVPVSPPPAPVVAAVSDAEERLRAVQALLGGGGVSEARVLELIQQHGTVTVSHTVEVRQGEATKVIAGAHPKMALLLRVLGARDHAGRAPQCLLVGPTASGKTHACEQAAEALGLPFYLHGAMGMTHELLGFVDAGGTYHRTPFRDAFEHGGVVLLDELDSWDAAVTLALNAALANGVAAFPDGMVRRHKDCIVVGAANTWGTGATAEYVGRTRLDAAFLSRFPCKIQWERDNGIEDALAQGMTDWAARVRAARDRAAKAGLKHLIDPRHTSAGAALIMSGMSSDMAAALTYQAGLSAEQVRMVEGL